MVQCEGIVSLAMPCQIYKLGILNLPQNSKSWTAKISMNCPLKLEEFGFWPGLVTEKKNE